MREKIIVAPGLRGNELLSSLARHDVNSFNTRVCDAAELAELVLMRSGAPLSGELIDSAEELALVANAIKDEDYFGVPSFSDVGNITRALRTARCLIAQGNEREVLVGALSRGLFKEKNEALVRVYERYIAALKERGAIDTVMLVRKAVETAKPMDADFFTLVEFPLSPLAQALVDTLSGSSVVEKRVQELFTDADEAPSIESFKRCYGAPTEVDSILADIYAGKQLDQCTIAVADTGTYAQLFFDVAVLHDVPVTFGCGIPIVNSRPAELLKLYFHWAENSKFGPAALARLLNSDAFNKEKLTGLLPEQDDDFKWGDFWDALGALRLCDDRAKNEELIAAFDKAAVEEAALMTNANTKDYKKVHARVSYAPLFRIIAQELGLPAEEFIAKYARVRYGGNEAAGALVEALDKSALQAIVSTLSTARLMGIERPTEDAVQGILARSVCRQSAAAGKLHVTSIDGAFSAIRDNLFIAGLSASNYPGFSKENHLLLDDDLDQFGADAKYLKADERIKRKRDRLQNLVRLASNAGSTVRVSYAGMNVADLKNENASSLLFELYRDAHGDDATMAQFEEAVIEVGYFDPPVSATRGIGIAYNDGKAIVSDAPPSQNETDPVAWDLEGGIKKKGYSPSALKKFFDCPKRFMFERVLGVPEPNEDNDSSIDVLPPIPKGNLAHALMEELADTKVGPEEFAVRAGEYFDRYVTQNPPLVEADIAKARQEFVGMMNDAYANDPCANEPHRDVVLKEEEITYEHRSGVKLYGFPDRVERVEDGKGLVVDFKTGRRVEQTEGDPSSCIQALIYACIMEHLKESVEISGVEYRYLQRGTVVSCPYDKSARSWLSERIEQFKEALLRGDYPLADEEARENGSCKYCSYGSICGKDSEEEGVA